MYKLLKLVTLAYQSIESTLTFLTDPEDKNYQLLG